MRRKPSASHCVKYPSLLRYRPESAVFVSGSMRTTVVMCAASPVSGRLRPLSLSVYAEASSATPSTATETSAIASPSSHSAAAGTSGLRRIRKSAVTRAWSSWMAMTRSTVSTHHAGGVYWSR